MLRLARALAQIFAVAVLVLSTDAGAITFNDGLVHVIDAANSYPFESTTVMNETMPRTTTPPVQVAEGEQVS